MVKVAVTVAELPQLSVAVQVTVAVPVAPQRSLRPAKLLVIVTSPQASSATGLFSQFVSSPGLPAPSQFTVIFSGSAVNIGASVSTVQV